MYDDFVITILHFHIQRMKKNKQEIQLTLKSPEYYSAYIDVYKMLELALTCHNLFKYFYRDTEWYKKNNVISNSGLLT